MTGASRGRPPREVVWLLAGAAALYVAFWLVVHLRSLLVMLVISLFLAIVAALGSCWSTRCRELPKAAYSSSAPGAAYSPTTGDTPAMEA